MPGRNKFRTTFSALAFCFFISAFAFTPVKANSKQTLLSPAVSEKIDSADYLKIITPQEINTVYEGTKLRGKRPVIAYPSNKVFETALNIHFQAQFDEFKKLSGESVKTLTFSYAVSVSDDYVNILFYCDKTTASTEKNVLTTVIDSNTGKILTIPDIIGVNGIKLFNKALSEQIAANPSHYTPSFTGISQSHGFYVYDDDIIFTFNEFELITAKSGIVEIYMSIPDIKNVTFDINKNEYYTKSNYSIKMIQLRRLADVFGYTLVWKKETSAIEIYMNQTLITTLNVGQNSYSSIYQPIKKELETAPEIVDNRTYLPASFYEQYLGLAYNIDQDGLITISSSVNPQLLTVTSSGE